MIAMPVIASPSFAARRHLSVVVRMAVICFTIPWQLSRSSTLFSSTHDGVACPVTVHPPTFFSIAHVPRDSGGGCPSRQGLPFCVMGKLRIIGGM